MPVLRFAAVAALLALAACGGAGGPSGGGEVVSLASGAAFTPRPVAAVRAFAVLPPEAGAVVAIGERRYANGAAQTVTLAGETQAVGENLLEVAIRTAPPRTSALENAPMEVPMERPTGEAIAAELASRFPDVAMVVADEDVSNAYGPFGYAAGRAPSGRTCVHAWQWIEDVDGRPAERSLLAGLRRPASVRVRLCRAASERRIVDWLKAMRLQVDGDGRATVAADPAGGPGAADALGTASAAPGFVGAAPPAVAADEPPAPRRARTGIRERSPARPAPASAAPTASRAPVASAARTAPVAPAAPAAPAADPGRYAVVPAPR